MAPSAPERDAPPRGLLVQVLAASWRCCRSATWSTPNTNPEWTTHRIRAVFPARGQFLAKLIAEQRPYNHYTKVALFLSWNAGQNTSLQINNPSPFCKNKKNDKLQLGRRIRFENADTQSFHVRKRIAIDVFFQWRRCRIYAPLMRDRTRLKRKRKDHLREHIDWSERPGHRYGKLFKVRPTLGKTRGRQT